MRDHSQHIELSRNEATEQILAKLREGGFGGTAEGRVEQVPVSEAFGRVLAEDVCSICDVPNVLTCCMDSVALRWEDFEGLGEGEVPDTSDWVRGVQWEFANTGVAMPEGFDTAVVIEHAEVSDDEQHVKITAAPSERFAGTRAPGEMMKAGTLVVAKGSYIDADVAARIAGAGVSNVLVLPKPRVSFIPTGNELITPGLPYSASAPEKFAARAHVFETNSVVVRGKVESWLGEYVGFDIVADERDDIKAALLRACEVSDIVVLNAGSSKGSDDWSVEVLEEIGDIICHQTNHGPGHHSSFAVLRASDGRVVPVVGISGPSGGASFTLDFYLRPVMREFMGMNPVPNMVHCKLAESLGVNKHKRSSQPKKLAGESRPPEAVSVGASFYAVKFMELYADEEGQLWAKPVKGRPGSAQTQHANAMYMCPAGPDSEPPAVGSVIEVELRGGRLALA